MLVNSYSILVHTTSVHVSDLRSNGGIYYGSNDNVHNVAYSSQLGSTTTIATIQGLIGATYYGMGRGRDSFVGGFLMKRFEVD